MKSTTYVFSGTIGAPSQEVFALLTDPARFPDWLPGCRGAEGPTPLRKAARFRLRVQTPLRTREVQLEVIDYGPPETFGWAEVGPRNGAKTFFKLQFGGGSTRVTMKHIWEPRGLSAWLRGVLFRRRRLEKQFDGALQNFRKILTT